MKEYENYLGDGLYVDFDGYQIELYSSNGISKTNQVYLDSDVILSFLDWCFEHFSSLSEHYRGKNNDSK